MDDTEINFITDLSHHWPTLAWLVPILVILYYIVRFLAVAYEPISKLMGKLGTHWRDSAEKRQVASAGEVGILRDEVRSLTEKVEYLEKRDAIYWAYVLYDQEWHREVEAEAIEKEWKFRRHLSFMEFRNRWRIQHHDIKSNDLEQDMF